MGKKLIVSVLLTLSLIFTFSVLFVCSAEDVSNGEYLVNKEQVIFADELAEVKETINIYYNHSSSILDDLKGDTLQFESAYRLFFTTNPGIISDYNEKGNFEEMIEDSYSWQIPTSSGGLVTVQKTDNNWMIIGVRLPSVISNIQKCPEDIDKEAIVDIINTNEKLTNAIDFKYVISNMYNMSFAYVKTDSDEFLIPFYYDELNIKELESGNLYTPKELFAILTDNYNLESNEDEVINSDETLSTKEISSIQGTSTLQPLNYTIIIVISIAFLLTASVAVISILKHKKRLNPKFCVNSKKQCKTEKNI